MSQTPQSPKIPRPSGRSPKPLCPKSPSSPEPRRSDTLAESGNRRRARRCIIQRMQPDHQAIASCVPCIVQGRDQIQHHPRYRRRILIFVDPNPANLMAGKAGFARASFLGRVGTRQIDVRQIGSYIRIGKIDNQSGRIFQLAYDGNQRTAGQDFDCRSQAPLARCERRPARPWYQATSKSTALRSKQPATW